MIITYDRQNIFIVQATDWLDQVLHLSNKSTKGSTLLQTYISRFSCNKGVNLVNLLSTKVAKTWSNIGTNVNLFNKTFGQ
jgi:hypothetical protein